MSTAPQRPLFTPEQRLNYADAFIQVDQQPIDLDFWQQDYIRDINRFAMVCKSRRTGYSFVVALKGIIKANDKARYKYTRQFISYNEEDAKEKINYAKEFYHSIPKKHKKELVSETKTSMEFYDAGKRTTSRLISIACRPPRGRGGDIVLDEWAFYPQNKQKLIYTASLPVISRGGCFEGGSSPFGKMGMFSDMWGDQNKEFEHFSKFTVPWWICSKLCTNVAEAVKLAPHMETEERVELFGTDIIKYIFKSMFLEDFQQEYECSFLDFALSYIPFELLDANTPGMRENDRKIELAEDEIEAVDDDGIEVKVFRTVDELLEGYDRNKHGRLYVGFDVARFRDASVIFVFGQNDSGKKRAVAEIEMVNTKFRIQRENMQKILRGLPVVRGAMDRTGLGLQLSEELQEEFGETMIEGVDFTPASKELLAVNFKKGLENTEFLLHNDKKFRRQVHSIKRMAGYGGIFRYDSQRDEDGHADSFWASALANYAVVESVNIKPNFWEERARKKQAGMLQSNTVIDVKPSNSVGSSLTSAKRGKSIDSVLRGISRANS